MTSYCRRLASKKILSCLKRVSLVPRGVDENSLASAIRINKSLCEPQFSVSLEEIKKHAYLDGDFQTSEKSQDEGLWKLPDSCELENLSVAENRLQIKVSRSLVSNEILKTVRRQHDRFGYKRNYTVETNKETVVVEYSSPNIAKPFHAGHLRSTIIGNFIANLYEVHGNKVIRLNYLGDWGTQFGLLCVGFKMYGSMEKLEKESLQHLFEVYVKINEAAEWGRGAAIDGLVKEGLDAFKKLEDGDEEYLSLWRKFRDISIEEYKKTYKRLGVSFSEYHGESMYQQQVKDLIERLKRLGLLQFDEETGIGYVQLDEGMTVDNNKANILKSDGTSLYITRDVAAAIDRYEKYNFDKMHYVVEEGQHQHFRHLIGVLRRLQEPWVLSKTLNDIHIKFGLIKGMSTRKGNVVFLVDMLNEAKKRMLETMQEKETTKERENIEEVADILGISAIIIQDLKNKRQHKYQFSWKRMLHFKSNSGVFLQYAHARLCSLEENCGVDLTENFDVNCLQDDVSYKLILHLGRYEDVVQEALNTLEPNNIVMYLFELGHLINKAFHDLPVKGSSSDIAQARLHLFHCSRIVLSNGLKLLGVKPLKKM